MKAKPANLPTGPATAMPKRNFKFPAPSSLTRAGNFHMEQK